MSKGNFPVSEIVFIIREIPEEFLDQTDVAHSFQHNIFDVSRTQHRIARVSKGSIKKSFGEKFLQFCELKLQQRYTFWEKMHVSKRELISWADSLRDFFNLMTMRASAYRFLNGDPKMKLDVQFRKTISLFSALKLSLNNRIDKFVYRSCLETLFASFPSNCLNYTVMSL